MCIHVLSIVEIISSLINVFTNRKIFIINRKTQNKFEVPILHSLFAFVVIVHAAVVHRGHTSGVFALATHTCYSSRHRRANCIENHTCHLLSAPVHQLAVCTLRCTRALNAPVICVRRIISSLLN